MTSSLESTSTFARVQRARNGMRLGACVMISADDLAFIDSSIERLEIQKKRIDDGLILEIRGVQP